MIKKKRYRIVFIVLSLFVLLTVFGGCFLYSKYQGMLYFLDDSSSMPSKEYEEFRTNYLKKQEEKRAEILKERQENPLDDSEYFDKELYDSVFGEDDILKIPLIQSDKESILPVFSSVQDPENPELQIENQVRAEMCDFNLAMQNLDIYSYENEHYIENDVLYVVENQEKYPLIYFTPNSFYLNLTVSNSLGSGIVGNVLLDMYYLSFSDYEDFYINLKAITEIFYYISLYDETLADELNMFYKISAPLNGGYD